MNSWTMEWRWRDFRWKPAGMLRINPATESEPGSFQCHWVSPDSGGAFPVTQLSSGKVVGDLRLAVSRDNRVVEKVQFIHQTEDAESHSVMRPRWRKPIYLRGRTLLLGASNGDNYYHWLFDSLPRLKLAQDAGWNWGGIDWVLLNWKRHPFHRESLEALGIPYSKCVAAPKRTVLRTDELIVPGMPGMHEVLPEWSLKVLREWFLKDVLRDHGRRILVSRKRAGSRRIVNEGRLEDSLKAKGFESVVLEEMTFMEQVRTFAEAFMVVAPHGAGLSNLVFCRPGTQVIELTGTDSNRPWFRILSERLGLPYRSVECETVGDGDMEQADLMVPVERVDPMIH